MCIKILQIVSVLLVSAFLAIGISSAQDLLPENVRELLEKEAEMFDEVVAPSIYRGVDVTFVHKYMVTKEERVVYKIILVTEDIDNFHSTELNLQTVLLLRWLNSDGSRDGWVNEELLGSLKEGIVASDRQETEV
jgi:hypothetical protein